jgi:hypothetical protein
VNLPKKFKEFLTPNKFKLNSNFIYFLNFKFKFLCEFELLPTRKVGPSGFIYHLA